MYYVKMESPIAEIMIVANEDSVIALGMDNSKDEIGAHADWQLKPSHPVLKAAVKQLQEYFARKRQNFDLPLSFKGTKFQESVWRELIQIPYGQTISYGEQARRIRNPKAVRAVGLANGKNPIGIIIPCHRVIGANGKLTGYGGGLPRKKFLLDLEAGGRLDF